MKNFKLLKEESTYGVLVLLAFVAVHFAIAKYFPNTLVFDLMSELEVVAFATVKVSLLIMLTYWIMRVAWPNAYKYLRDGIYEKYESFSSDYKLYLTVGIATLIFLALNYQAHASSPCKYSSEKGLRSALLDSLDDQVGIREATGRNDGDHVKRYLNSVGLDEGHAWCVAYVSYNLQEFEIDNPNSAWSPDYAKRNDMVWYKGKVIKSTPLTGDVFTVYSNYKGRVVHGGFYIKRDRSTGYFVTIEGNTNDDGSSEGIGVFRRRRNPLKIYAITNYITPSYAKHCNTDNDVSGSLGMQAKPKSNRDTSQRFYNYQVDYDTAIGSYDFARFNSSATVCGENRQFRFYQYAPTNHYQWFGNCNRIYSRWSITSQRELCRTRSANQLLGKAAGDIPKGIEYNHTIRSDCENQSSQVGLVAPSHRCNSNSCRNTSIHFQTQIKQTWLVV
ncbi:MAG: hypothetical protein CL843_16410 [Crocinitomicaceae bacterium]|nr:hypothetical protein [Crocinitomicaceae bacterium]